MINFKNKWIISIAVLILLFPVVTNFLVLSWRSNLTFGSDWMSFIATYYGGILGGFISGSLTLIGVIITIRSTTSGINQTLKEQRVIREEDILIQTSKDRLLNLYHPVYSLVAVFIHQYGAHQFIHLNKEQRDKFLNLMNDNIVYADKLLYDAFLQLRWSVREGNIEKSNKF